MNHQFTRTVIMLWNKGLSPHKIVEECQAAGNFDVDEKDIERIIDNEYNYPIPSLVGVVNL